MKNGPARDGHESTDDTPPTAGPQKAEYDAMMLLERLETLEEEMQELGVSTLDDVRRRITELNEQLDLED